MKAQLEEERRKREEMEARWQAERAEQLRQQQAEEAERVRQQQMQDWHKWLSGVAQDMGRPPPPFAPVPPPVAPHPASYSPVSNLTTLLFSFNLRQLSLRSIDNLRQPS